MRTVAKGHGLALAAATNGEGFGAWRADGFAVAPHDFDLAFGIGNAQRAATRDGEFDFFGFHF